MTVLSLNIVFLCVTDGNEEPIEIISSVTGVLGEDVYLSCRYVGESEVFSARWKHQMKVKSNLVQYKRIAGATNNHLFGRDGFSKPESAANLTIKVNVSSVELEGEYTCEFETEDDYHSGTAFLTVVAQPDIEVQVNAEIINGSHYQSVSCSALGGRPLPQISWLVDGLPPSNDSYTVNVSDTAHPNGTSTLSSILRFPTHVQDDDSVTCVVQHPTLPNPKLTTVRVETYTRPNVTIKAEMTQQGGSEFWVVSCVSSGGRPDTDISLALNAGEELHGVTTDTDSVSVLLPVEEYEGHNVTCVFDHPKFTPKETRVVTLPSLYLSVQLGNDTDGDFQDIESLELQEGQTDTVISLQITGNVPRYNITCTKDDEPLPEGVELVGSSLTVQGPLGHQHAGLFECFLSYNHLQAELKFNVTVNPRVIQPVPPTIRVDLQTEDGRSVIECSAADAVPAANMSWLLPEGVSGVPWFNFTSHNGSHSVRGVLLLPACSPWELTAECVINHPAFEEPENRSITLPLCAPPNITVNHSTEWKDGEEHTKVDCSVDSVATAASVTWHVGNSSISYVSESEVRADGLVSARSSVHFLSSLYAGQDLTCTVEHPSLEAPENRTIHIPVQKAHMLSVSVVRQQGSPLWLAVCDCRGEGAGTNLAWVLPENAKSQTFLQPNYKGEVQARLTYQFPLALHEGHNLTCVYQSKHGTTEEKTIHIPRYDITSVKVLNHTTPLQSRYGGEPVIHRLALQEHHQKQKVLLRVEGRVPEYDLICKRCDGSFVRMEGVAMVFQPELTEKDEGLYTCQASFYHHTATVNIQVEVMSEDRLHGENFPCPIFCLFSNLFIRKYLRSVIRLRPDTCGFDIRVFACVSAMLAMISFSSGLGILIIFVVVLWVCCKVSSRAEYKKQESLSPLTALMQEPGSPQVKQPLMTGEGYKESAPMISYSIVIDVKSTV
ncbi:Nectin-2 [Nibea albiflora]|uniref:Nectin-2 n=1 Tax=Nibea albiflora TaxID=240163 RepID=A0ACB7EIC3_NIBAL|nr:Nectin-2 [Nibea albiflora]